MQIKFLQKKPYYIFVIENFLSDEEYHLLDKNFPNEKDAGIVPHLGNRCRFENHDKHYKDLKNNRDISIEVLEKKFNDQFFIELTKKLKKEMLISRLKNLTNLKNLKNLYSLIRKIKIVEKEEQKTFFQRLFQSNFTRGFEFSYMYKNSYCRPHTDKQSKLLSLMLYFPSRNLENLSIGTTFYNSKLKNFSNKEYLFTLDENTNTFITDNNNNDFFDKNFTETITFPFKKKDLYCFIKSDVSWHSVKKLEIPENEVRKSININLKL